MSRNTLDFLKHEGSLPGKQNPATVLYMVQTKLSPTHRYLFLVIFNIISQDLFLLSYKHSYLDLKW
jgi:hypothetical protein